MAHAPPQLDSTTGRLPLRPGVGVVLTNASGLVFVGMRRPRWYPDANAVIWQMPQGGIEDGEVPYDAAQRELFEETNVRSTEYLGKASDWLTYSVPDVAIGVAMKGRYRGQRQRWFAMRFTGLESEIDVTGRLNGFKAEFTDWKWASVEDILGSTVPHKRDVYAAVFAEFSDLLA